MTNVPTGLPFTDAVLSEGRWCGAAPAPPPPLARDQIVGSRVAFAEMALRDRVKQGGGAWNPDWKVRQLRDGRSIELGLDRRIVDAPASNSGCRRSSGEHLHADARTHPPTDAGIHCWMPASYGRCQRVQSNTSSAHTDRDVLR